MTCLEQIENSNQNICNNLKHAKNDSINERGFYSNNLLKYIRDLIEGVFGYIYNVKNNANLEYSQNNYHIFKKYALDNHELNFITKFHQLLQNSSSHYSLSDEIAERVFIKYLKHLNELKIFMKKNFNIEILENIDDFPLNYCQDVQQIYNEVVKEFSDINLQKGLSKRYYIQKIKPFFVNKKMYFEITLISAYDYASKTDRMIVYSEKCIDTNYCVTIEHVRKIIKVSNIDIDVNILLNYKISIRPCEFKNLFKLLGIELDHIGDIHTRINNYLTQSGLNLFEICSCSEKVFNDFLNNFESSDNNQAIIDGFKRIRNIIVNHLNGSNILKYLLFIMNNRVLKSQYEEKENQILSNLYLKCESIPFDEMPYCSDLHKHKVSISNLYECISSTNREHEFIAKKLNLITQDTNSIYHELGEFSNNKNIELLISKHTEKLYYKHTCNEKDRRILDWNKKYYIGQNENIIKSILDKLISLASTKIDNMTANNEMDINAFPINQEKKDILKNMFNNNSISLIYGSAGTGKTELIKYFSKLNDTKEKLFITHTYSALNNLKNRIDTRNSRFITADSFIERKEKFQTEIVIFDECSTIDNAQMYNLLNSIEFKCAIFVGDVYQIESIELGNWFYLISKFVPKNVINLLTENFRTNNSELQNIWKEIREIKDESMLSLDLKKYSHLISDELFRKCSDDEIILCLNYNGLYGINSINNYFQNNNPNEEFYWDGKYYKKEDPIIFNDSKAYPNIFYNNLKGKIIDISKENDKYIVFTLEIFRRINYFGYFNNVKIIENNLDGHAIVSLTIHKKASKDDEDNEINNYYVPFDVAYAMSIHKSQGLEFDSVKIIITDEIDEKISHSIFYTAITRAKNQLAIYWSPETEKKIISNFTKLTRGKDANILAEKFKYKMYKNQKYKCI